jgi:hypothetical protein
VEATVELPIIDYKNFITDLYVDRPFIEEHMDVSRVDYDGIWHCILVKQRGKEDGVLIMSEGHDYPKWAASYRYETDSSEQDDTVASGGTLPPS